MDKNQFLNSCHGAYAAHVLGMKASRERDLASLELYEITTSSEVVMMARNPANGRTMASIAEDHQYEPTDRGAFEIGQLAETRFEVSGEVWTGGIVQRMRRLQ